MTGRLDLLRQPRCACLDLGGAPVCHHSMMVSLSHVNAGGNLRTAAPPLAVDKIGSDFAARLLQESRAHAFSLDVELSFHT